MRRFEWLSALLGSLLIGDTFAPWYRAGDRLLSAWRALTVIDIVVVIAALLGLLLGLMAATHRTPAVTIAACSLTTVVAGIAALLLLYRALSLPELTPPPTAAEPGIWAALALSAALATAGWWNMNDDVLPERLAPSLDVPRLPPPSAEGHG